MDQPAMGLRQESISEETVTARRAFEGELLKTIPHLRAFARLLVGNPAEADDLVQDTVTRALGAFKSFEMHTNMKAWTFTILRNIRINRFRRPRVESLEDYADERAINPNQLDNLELNETMGALAKLSPDHREVIILIRANGLEYEEAAAIMGCKVGTIKSRLNRADAMLRRSLGLDGRPPRQPPGSPTKAV